MRHVMGMCDVIDFRFEMGRISLHLRVDSDLLVFVVRQELYDARDAVICVAGVVMTRGQASRMDCLEDIMSGQ
jgi:hypothetical protein